MTPTTYAPPAQPAPATTVRDRAAAWGLIRDMSMWGAFVAAIGVAGYSVYGIGRDAPYVVFLAGAALSGIFTTVFFVAWAVARLIRKAAG